MIHVWEAHEADLLKHGCEKIDDVAALIAKMIAPRTQIYCDSCYLPDINAKRQANPMNTAPRI